MAVNRMGGKRWLTDDKRKAQKDKEGFVNPRKLHASADELKSLTVPGQSKSIREMMDRYEKGRPLPEVQ